MLSLISITLILLKSKKQAKDLTMIYTVLPLFNSIKNVIVKLRVSLLTVSILFTRYSTYFDFIIANFSNF